MEKLKRFWKSVKLRLSLLRIWFMKNILLFLRIACVVCLVCIFTGVITADTPILGSIIYPIFAPLADEINAIIMEKEIDGLMTFFSVAISVLFTISMFALKAKNIAQSDIKSTKLKYALVQANLYFNEDGKLVKKIEKATGEDIDRDGKIDEKEIVDAPTKKGFIRGMISAFQEFNTIMKADLSNIDDKEDEDYTEIVETVGLSDAEEATEEIKDLVRVGTENAISDKGVEIADEKIEDTLNDNTLSEEEKVNKISLITKAKDLFRKLRKPKKEKTVKEESVDVVVDNMNEHSETKEKIEKTKEVKKEKVVETVVEEPKVTSTKEKAANDFLQSLRNRK